MHCKLENLPPVIDCCGIKQLGKLIYSILSLDHLQLVPCRVIVVANEGREYFSRGLRVQRFRLESRVRLDKKKIQVKIITLTGSSWSRMKLIQLIQLITLAALFTVALTNERFDDDGDDCCQLEWTPIIEAGHKRFIPADAVVAGRDINGTNWYYIRKPNREETGIISDIVTKFAVFYKYRSGIVEDDTWNGGYILTNPNQCIIGHLERTGVFPFDETTEKQFPRVRYHGFAYYPGVNDSAISIGNAYENDPGNYRYYGVRLATRGFHQSSYGEKVLYVDCRASLMRQLSAELYDMDIDVKQLIGSQEHQAVARTEVVNDGEYEQMAHVDLTADINTAVDMKHDNQLSTVAETKWGVHSSLNLKFLENFFKVAASASRDSHSLKDNFTSTGSVRFESSTSTYKFTQSVRMKAKSRTKIVINTRPIQGSQKFTAYYKLTPKVAFSKSLTLERTLGTLQRLGFRDFGKIRKVKGTLVLAYEGYLSVDSGFDTHVLIESVPLSGDGEIERRIIPFPLVAQ